MDGSYQENGIFAVVGDTARRLEVQLLDNNGLAKDTTGLTLRLSVDVKGKVSYVDGTLVTPAEGIYRFDLTNGLFLEAGEYPFQWKLFDASNNEIKSAPFYGKIGTSLSEGGNQSYNFYIDYEELKTNLDNTLGLVDTLKDIGYFKEAKNRFDKTKAEKETFLNYSTGGLNYNANYSTSGFIEVKAGRTETFQNVRVSALYDVNQVIIPGTGQNTGSNAAVKTFTPTQDGFIRLTYSTAMEDLVQLELGSVATAYEPYTDKFQVLHFTDGQKEEITNLAKELIPTEEVKPIKLVKNGSSFEMTSEMENGKEIVINGDLINSPNNSLTIISTKIGGNTVHLTTDDVTPIRTNIATLGARHGYTNIIEIIMTNHGKTNVDLGSKWTDGVGEYTLLKVNGDSLQFGSPYTVENGIVASVKTVPTANLTHVSGATNTSAVSIANMTNNAQLYPSVNNVETELILDGKKIKDNGIYYGDNVLIKEKYNIMSYKGIIDFAQNNIGQDFANDTVPALVELNNTFMYSTGLKCTTTHSLTVLEKINLGRSGFLQSGPLELTGHHLKRYMPNVKEKSGFDFGNGVDMLNYSTSLYYTSTDYADPNVPPNHYVDVLIADTDDKRKYGFAMGYIVDKTNSKNSDRVENTTISWDMRATKKSYPVAVEGIFEVGSYLTFTGFRNYLIEDDLKDDTIVNVVKDAKDTYVYMQSNKITIVKKELEKEIGKRIDLLQNESLQNLNEMVDGNGVVARALTNKSSGIIKVN